MKAFVDGKSQAGEAVIKQNTAYLKPGLGVQHATEGTLCWFFFCAKFVATVICFGDAIIRMNFSEVQAQTVIIVFHQIPCITGKFACDIL